MIMHAREIPECILSLKALAIDKVWFRGYTEKQLEPKIRQFIESTSYDRYIMVSDDVIATQFALDNLIRHQKAADVVTGWCNIFPGETLANLELRPITEDRSALYFRIRDRIPRSTLPFIKKLYHKSPLKAVMNWVLYQHFPTEDEIWVQPEVFRTYFVGWALTSITRELWLKYGFHHAPGKNAGHGSDQKMSLDLANDGVEMLCARDSFIYHLGTIRNFIVGKVKPDVIFEGDIGMVPNLRQLWSR